MAVEKHPSKRNMVQGVSRFAHGKREALVRKGLACWFPPRYKPVDELDEI
jgi:hypothetical protein